MKKRPDISGIRSLVSICGCASILIHLAPFARGWATALMPSKGMFLTQSPNHSKASYPHFETSPQKKRNGSKKAMKPANIVDRFFRRQAEYLLSYCWRKLNVTQIATKSFSSIGSSSRKSQSPTSSTFLFRPSISKSPKSRKDPRSGTTRNQREWPSLVQKVSAGLWKTSWAGCSLESFCRSHSKRARRQTTKRNPDAK